MSKDISVHTILCRVRMTLVEFSAFLQGHIGVKARSWELLRLGMSTTTNFSINQLKSFSFALISTSDRRSMLPLYPYPINNLVCSV